MHRDLKTIKLHCFREKDMRSHGMKEHEIPNKTVSQQTEARKNAVKGKRWHQCFQNNHIRSGVIKIID